MHVAVCGADGVGKSTIVRALARVLSVAPFEEQPEKLDRFVEWLANPNEETLVAAQRQFLDDALSRHIQAREHGGVQERMLYDNFEVFCRTFARTAALSPDAFDLLRVHYEACLRQCPAPDVVVVLQAPVDVVIARCSERGRADDQVLDAGFLSLIVDGYTAFAGSFGFAPVYEVNAEAALDQVLERVVAVVRRWESSQH